MSPIPQTHLKSVVVDDGIKVFYREAGSESKPAFLLLHGFPSSSFQYRNLIPLLADKYHVFAPDLPGFGFTEVPEDRNYSYTFDSLTKTVGAFIDAVGIKKFIVYVFDYGAPTGFRLMLQRPDQVIAVVSQNGNAYVEGLGDFWNTVKAYWEDPSPQNKAPLESLTGFDTTKFQYVTGAPNPESIAPETYHLDYHLMTRPGNADIQLGLLYDYRNNVTLYPAFQEYFRTHKLPILAVWGKNDPFFIPPGAEAFNRDSPNVNVKFVDAGHFALESHVQEIANEIIDFLDKSKLEL
ncbi:Haloalkane Dehalogenase Enzyme [Abortiporus biennis]